MIFTINIVHSYIRSVIIINTIKMVYVFNVDKNNNKAILLFVAATFFIYYIGYVFNYILEMTRNTLKNAFAQHDLSNN